LVTSYTRTKGRVVESASTPTERMRSGPDRRNNVLGVDRVVAYKAQPHCPRLEGLVPYFSKIEN